MARPARMRFVIAYDVSDDGKRGKLANLLLDYGERVQKSVFEAELSSKDVQELLTRAVNYLEQEDSLRLYPLCQTCTRNVQIYGRSPAAAPETWRIV